MFPIWEFLEDVYRRIYFVPTELNVEKLQAGLNALNTELQNINNNQPNLFTIRYKFVPLLPSIPTYSLGSDVINPLEVIFTTPIRANYFIVNGVKVEAGIVDPPAFRPAFFSDDGGDVNLGPESSVSFIYPEGVPIQFIGLDVFGEITPEDLRIEIYREPDSELISHEIKVKDSLDTNNPWWAYLRAPGNFRQYTLTNYSTTQSIPIRRILLNVKPGSRTDLVIGDQTLSNDIPVVGQNRMTYLAIPNKTQVGTRPTIYYFDYEKEPTLTIWNLMAEYGFGKGANRWNYQPGLQISYESYLPILTIHDEIVWPKKFTMALKYGVAYTLSLMYRNELSQGLLSDRENAYEKVGFADSNPSQQEFKPKLSSFSSF